MVKPQFQCVDGAGKDVVANTLVVNGDTVALPQPKDIMQSLHGTVLWLLWAISNGKDASGLLCLRNMCAELFLVDWHRKGRMGSLFTLMDVIGEVSAYFGLAQWTSDAVLKMGSSARTARVIKIKDEKAGRPGPIPFWSR